MIRQIREHDLQYFLVDYSIGPALHCFYIGRQKDADVFRLETTTGVYQLRLSDCLPTDSCDPVMRLDGSYSAVLSGKSAYIVKFCRDNDAPYYFYKESA